MKMTIAIACALACPGALFAQGTVSFNNNVPGSVVAPIFNLEAYDPTIRLHGNSASGFPPGPTVYTGGPLDLSSYVAQLWCGPLGANANQLVPAAGYSLAPMQSGPGAGFWVPSAQPAVVPGIPQGGTAVLQVRAWNTRGGKWNTWDEALANFAIVGTSELFTSQPLGGSTGSPDLIGLTSFNVATTIIPEPATFELAAFGAAALWLWRRRG